MTDVNGYYYFPTFNPGDYIDPVSSGTMGQANTNPGAQGYMFSPEFCKVGDTMGRSCESQPMASDTQDFAAMSKYGPGNPPISDVFKLPVPAGSIGWSLITEAGDMRLQVVNPTRIPHILTRVAVGSELQSLPAPQGK
jgi:hypothetical protein